MSKVQDIEPVAYQPQPYGQQPQQPFSHQQTHNTTVVVNQPGAQVRVKREWRTGVLACCDDIPICLLTWFCPTCYGCYLAMEADESCCLACCCQGWQIALRSHIRGKLGIQGSVLNDFCAATCCAPCVVCQLAREIQESKASGEWYTT